MFSESPAELTTAATDLALGVESLLVARLAVPPGAASGLREAVWRWVLMLTAVASLLGALAHGISWSVSVLDGIWKLLYLDLGFVAALFLVGAVIDWRGARGAGRLIPMAFAAGALFFGLTQWIDGGFVLFIVYEAVVMLAALAIYLTLARRRRLAGAGAVAVAIVLSLVAAALQASDLAIVWIVPFDHNSLFHLMQMPAVVLLGVGVRRGSGGGLVV
jgi:hypothetical protein